MIPLDLPFRAPEAGRVAEAVLAQLKTSPRLDDAARARIETRIEALRLESLTAFARSIEADPVHNGVYYIAVDSREPFGHYLLRIAPAAAPATSSFRKPILIARLRLATGPEVVLNAIPFAPDDPEAIQTFTSVVNRAFLPRPCGPQALISVSGSDWVRTAESVMQAAASLPRQASVWLGLRTDAAELKAAASAASWAAVRAGWRGGYSLCLDDPALPADHGLATRYACRTASGALEFQSSVRRTRPAEARSFDLDIVATAPEAAALRSAGVVVHGVEAPLDGQWLETAEAVKRLGAALVVDGASANQALLTGLNAATAGRWHWKQPPGRVEAAQIVALATELRTGVSS